MTEAAGESLGRTSLILPVEDRPASPGVPREGSAYRSARPGARLPPLPFLVPRGARAHYVRVRAPFSIANVGPGFDRFGLCLEGPSDVLEVRRGRSSSFEVVGAVPRARSKNCAFVAAASLLRLAGSRASLRVRLTKGYRGGSGIGSSGASAVAGALGAAALLGLDPADPATGPMVARAALEGERVASGEAHLDNVAASLWGGFVLVEGLSPLVVHRVWPPPDLRVVVALSDAPLETRRARSVLPRSVPMADAVSNVARASALVHGLLTENLEQVGRNLVDRLAEPYRTPLIPGLREARRAGERAGAWGVAVAGGGPALWALAPGPRAREVAHAMREAMGRSGVRATTFECAAGTGARLEEWA